MSAAAALMAVLAVLPVVESGGNSSAVGDRGLRNRAYGEYQIRQPCVDDVNAIAGAEVVKTWGRPLSIGDMVDSRKAKWVAGVYLRHYGDSYQRKTGRPPTAEVYARIYNGGPQGWRKASTLAYWSKVRAAMAAGDGRP